MRVVTWNVNSLRARQERVETWLEEVQPDVLLIQETKLADDAFPMLAFEAMGYTCAHYGQGQWNGVAILSKVGLTDVVSNFAEGIEPDPAAAVEWFQKAAEQDHAEALHHLGLLLDKGKGVERNLGEAIKFYRKAARLGNRQARERLGAR